MNKRRIISGVLAICILVLSMTMSFAVEVTNPDNTTKAQALNKLGMLAGDGKGNYNLTSALKRSEAATFVVKLMGKNDNVLENKALYINTGFTDVKSADWFAAYVGYCKENDIISGLGYNKFGPKEDVTEKAFLTMTMKILGYTSNDFQWGYVYQKAFEIGLVTDEVYKDKKDDNKQYTRAEVVNVMYKALGLKIKDTNTTLIKKLISDGIIDSPKAADAGFISDELPSNITEISVSGEQWLTIKFNETVRPISVADIQIYERDTKASLKFKIEQQTDTELKIKTDSQKPSMQYVLSAGNIIDTQENAIKIITSGFSGYENKGIVSDYFKISKVEQRSNNEVKVYFTHPININAEQPDFYSILQDGNALVTGDKNTIAVKVAKENSNAIIINTKNFVFQPDTEYTVKIKGTLISAYGTNLGLDAGDQKNFFAKTMQAEQFKLSGLTALNDKTIQLDYNKQINKATSENIFSYIINEMIPGTQIQIVKAVLTDNSYGTDCGVILTVAGSLDSKKAYALRILYVTDVTREYEIEEQKVTFNGSTQASSDLKITSVQPIDLNSILVTFDKNIDPESAQTLSNYMIFCLNNTSYALNPMKAVYSADKPKSVVLYIDTSKPMTAGLTYKINIATAYRDYTGTKIPIPLEYNYIANNITKSKPEIVKAVFIAKDTVKINFSKDITLDSPNILTQNYYIQVINDESTKKVPLAINYIDKNTIVLKFDKIEFTNQYYFKYDKIKDITGETYSGSQINTAIVQGE